MSARYKAAAALQDLNVIDGLSTLNKPRPAVISESMC